MNKFQVIIFFVINFSIGILNAQKTEFSGYVSEMPSEIWTNQPQSTFFWQNLVHNRLNFGWQINKNFRFDVNARTRLLAGSEKMLNADEINADNGAVDLSWNIFEKKNTILNTSLDRLYFTFEKNKISLKFGRQRINWGQTFVWNPNDIFNTYSFFDFDYPERSGCDAIRATYYHSAVSSSELAVSLGHGNEITAAAMHRWNWKNFDFQLIAGAMDVGGTKFPSLLEYQPADLVLGGAWSGDIKGVSFRGEFSYFNPLENHAGFTQKKSFSSSVGLDYTFSNSLFLQAEMLYNTNKSNNSLLSSVMMGSSSQPLSPKNLSFAQWNIFSQASYPFTPRLNGAVSAIYYPDKDGFYGGFSLEYSLLQNLDLSVFMQNFYVSSNPKDVECLLGFVRLKYSF